MVGDHMRILAVVCFLFTHSFSFVGDTYTLAALTLQPLQPNATGHGIRLVWEPVA
jgi:hypothetical protein